ncbi:type I restriction enzyme S subunit [Marinobacter sp. LV10R520-4]|uniref:restriction endonuclease subunit S n=1 Tax=Marinobacter sp. LV10R520-4 TaxID=1761796 RepID=UPI000BF3C505|nr:restriction endonuclease subunit S [Marinobacter sp. LV10R520-4]PFG53391.1 type I restriction enzyme S subunit [Marinobacter sp. LV10R520-4]
MKIEVPVGWEVTTLGDVAGWGSGGTPSRRNPEFFNGSIPWIKTGELGDKFIRGTEEHISEDAIKKSSAKIFAAGSVGIAMYGATIGKLSIFGIDASTNQACAVAKPLCDLLSNEFLYYYLLSERRALIDSGKGGAQPNISQGILKDWPLSLPPLNEQHRIVAKIETLFSELDKGIESLKTAREQLKVYHQALLKHAFEGKLTAQWREQNRDKLETPEQLLARIKQERQARYQQQLKDWQVAVKVWEKNGKEGKKPGKPSQHKELPPITEDEIALLPVLPSSWGYARLAEISKIGSGMSVSKDRKLSDPVDVAYLRVANVQRGELVLEEIKRMPIEKQALPELALEKWDILFNEGGDRDKLGRGWIWEGQVEPCITQNHVFRSSPYFASEFHSKFISHWGNTFGKDYFEKGGKQTTNLASINKTVLSMFPVPLPSIEEQEMVIRALDDSMSLIGSLEAEVESSIAKCETLRQSILKKAFSGQLVPQDANDEPASALLARIHSERAGRSPVKTRVKE